MAAKGIFFILVQIEEAHTPAWPTGTIKLGVPQTGITDRISRAAAFAAAELPSAHFAVLVDLWTNVFANRFRAWPDKYYLIDAVTRVVKEKSTYGTHADALIDKDCVDVLYSL
jgi:hypothetical protein